MMVTSHVMYSNSRGLNESTSSTQILDNLINTETLSVTIVINTLWYEKIYSVDKR